MKLNIRIVNYKLAVSKDCACQWHMHNGQRYHMRCNACEIDYQGFLGSHKRRNRYDAAAWRGADENVEPVAKDFVGSEVQAWNACGTIPRCK